LKPHFRNPDRKPEQSHTPMNVKNLKTPDIPKARKLLASLPYLLVVAICINSWYKFLTHEYNPSTVHYVTLALVVLNGLVLCWRFKPGLLMTGAILLLAAFGLLFFLTIWASSVTLFGLTFPFEGWSFLLLILYIVINSNLLINWLLDAKKIKPLPPEE
jgi:hypothetical protein